MNFQESLAYLYGLGNEVSTMKLGLDNIKILLDALRNPEKKYLKVQIAGTNGKGSTCAFLEAICLSANIKMGLTTSPHLVSITERVKINGREISETDFARHATTVRETSEKLISEKKLETIPTYFEQVTAIALNAFAEASVELAILETGLGGRFDATTAARAEIVAVTPIDFDHQDILGNMLAEIASEKAAIIRKDTKVVVAAQKKEAENVIVERCASFGIAPERTHFDCEIVGLKNGSFTVNFQTERAKYKNARLNLLGRYQIENAKVAVLLAEILRENFNVSTENIIEGLQTAIHKGRLEFYKNFLFDGAHNAAGARALEIFLNEFIKQPITLIFGAMKDKDLKEISKTLFPKADKLIFTKIGNSRSMETSDLRRFLPENFEAKNVFQAETIEEALKIAGEITTDKDLICVTGSLYLVGEAQRHLTAKREQ